MLQLNHPTIGCITPVGPANVTTEPPHKRVHYLSGESQCYNWTTPQEYITPVGPANVTTEPPHNRVGTLPQWGQPMLQLNHPAIGCITSVGPANVTTEPPHNRVHYLSGASQCYNWTTPQEGTLPQWGEPMLQLNHPARVHYPSGASQCYNWTTPQ